MSFQPARLRTYTREALLAEIKRVVGRHFAGLRPTHKDFNRFSRVHSATVVKEFGSWADAMRSAGFESSRATVKRIESGSDPQQITPDLLLSELKTIANKHEGGYFSMKTTEDLGVSGQEEHSVSILGDGDKRSLISG